MTIPVSLPSSTTSFSYREPTVAARVIASAPQISPYIELPSIVRNLATSTTEKSDVTVFVDDHPLIIVRTASNDAHIDVEAPLFSAPTTALRLDQIKERLGLTVTQMAELFGVTRKSIYDWYEGTPPRKQHEDRISILIEVLNDLSSTTNLQSLKNIWHMNIAGESFVGVLHDERLDYALLLDSLTKKINELSPFMATPRLSSRNAKGQIGMAQLSEFERARDFI